MSLREDLNKVKKDLNNIKQNKSLAMEIIETLKRKNTFLKIALVISILGNIIFLII